MNCTRIKVDCILNVARLKTEMELTGKGKGRVVDKNKARLRKWKKSKMNREIRR